MEIIIFPDYKEVLNVLPVKMVSKVVSFYQFYTFIF